MIKLSKKKNTAKNKLSKFKRKSNYFFLIRSDLIKKAKFDAKKEAEVYSEKRRDINSQKETEVFIYTDYLLAILKF